MCIMGNNYTCMKCMWKDINEGSGSLVVPLLNFEKSDQSLQQPQKGVYCLSAHQGRFQKKIKGSSSMGVAATPLKPLPSCYRVKRRRD